MSKRPAKVARKEPAAEPEEQEEQDEQQEEEEKAAAPADAAGPADKKKKKRKKKGPSSNFLAGDRLRKRTAALHKRRLHKDAVAVCRVSLGARARI
jgi:hypothetical protein